MSGRNSVQPVSDKNTNKQFPVLPESCAQTDYYLGRMLSNGCGCRHSGLASLGDCAAVAKLLTLQGVQSVAVNTLPSPATESVECFLHLLQSLGQGKTIGEGIQNVRGTYNSGTVVYGLISQKAAVK